MTIPWTARCAVALAMLPCSSAGQVLTRLETASGVGVRAGSFTRIVPAGTLEPALTDLGATGRDPGGGLAVASLDYATLGQGHVTVALAASSHYEAGGAVGSVAGAVSDRSNDPAWHEHVWRLSGAGTGTVFVSATAIVGPFTSGAAGCLVDVGDDGVVDLIVQAKTAVQARDSEEIAVGVRVETGHDLLVRIRSSCHAAGGGAPGNSATASLRWDLRLLPGIQPARFSNYGSTCGAWMQGADRVGADGHHIELLALQGFPRQPVGFVFGVRAVAIPLAGGCELLVDPLGSVVVLADGQGLATLTLDLLPPLQATAYLQAVSLGTSGGWRVTDGLRVDLADL